MVRRHARHFSPRAIQLSRQRRHAHLRRYGFVAAYLQGELLEGETVYCFAPPGVERKGADGLNQICRILKPVYGI